MADLSLMVGDTVLIRGTVARASPGIGTVVVEVYSPAGRHQVAVREDLVESRVEVVEPFELPVEPPDGTWLVVVESAYEPTALHRWDAGAPDEPRRRPRRWRDYTADEWVDWPTAVRRGAGVGVRLVSAEETDRLVAQAWAGITPVGQHLIENGGYCRTCGSHHSPEEIARAEDRAEEASDG